MADLKRVDDEDGEPLQLEVNLSGIKGAGFQEAIAKIKAIAGSKFDWDTKRWLLPAEPQIAERVLNSLGLDTSEAVLEWVRGARHHQAAELTTPLPDDVTLAVPWSRARTSWQPEYIEIAGEREPFDGLMKHQRPVVDLAARARKLLICDDQGLGKCAMALSAVVEFLLRCAYEQDRLEGPGAGAGARPAIQGGEPREDAREGPKIQGGKSREGAGEGPPGRREEACEDSGHHRREEIRTLPGLRNIVAGAVHGLGSCDRAGSVSRRWVDQHPLHAREDSGADGPRGVSEVRGQVPELSSVEALARRPKLIICPSSVVGTWDREIRLWLGEEPVVARGSTRAARERAIRTAIEEGRWLIVNWEQVRAKREKVKTRNGGTKTVELMKEPLFEETNWLVVIADEIHRAKNRRSQQRRGLRKCRADDGLMLGLSGTPVQNSPDELWPLLEWLWPAEYTSFWRFYDQYVEFYETGGHYGGRVITGVKNPDALRFELKDRLVRRTQDILDLPGKHRISVPLDLSPEQRRLYKEAEDQMWVEVEQDLASGKIVGEDAKHVRDVLDGKATAYRLPNGATRTLRLRQILETPACLGGKDDSATLDAAVDKIMDSQPPWVIFCEFKATVEALVARLTNKGLVAEPYTGDQTNRPELEERFQAGQIDVLVGTIKAMKEGITLTAGNYQWWTSRDWVPAVNEQGEDRQHRIGQKNRVTIMIAEPQNTVATGKVKPTNKRKERIVRAVIPKIEIEES